MPKLWNWQNLRLFLINVIKWRTHSRIVTPLQKRWVVVKRKRIRSRVEDKSVITLSGHHKVSHRFQTYINKCQCQKINLNNSNQARRSSWDGSNPKMSKPFSKTMLTFHEMANRNWRETMATNSRVYSKLRRWKCCARTHRSPWTNFRVKTIHASSITLTEIYQ